MHNGSKQREPFFHIAKRTNLQPWKAFSIRAAAVVAALLVSSVVSSIITDGEGIGEFFANLFDGVFGTERRILNLFQSTAILLCLALAVTFAFKMKFWNIGAEGQTLVGGLACVACIQYMGGKVPEGVLILIMAVCSVAASIIWAVIPAIFKAKWNTNETLFTLMMNYIAMQLVACCIFVWVPSGSGVLGVLNHGHFPQIGGYNYILNIIIVALLTVLSYIYFRYSKHGYELSVVGESENTAKYIGINVKKVIIRTMIISGAFCGIAGLLLVAGTDHSLNTNTVAGRGFTGILVAWLGKFNPFFMCGTAMLYVFIDQGARQVATAFGMGGSFSSLITGIFFFFVIGCEFFVNYKVKFSSSRKFRIRQNGTQFPQGGVPAAQETESAEKVKEVNA